MTVLLYLLVLANSAFLIALFFIFRRYIRQELRKTDYAREFQEELQDFVRQLNHSAAELTQVIEDRTQQLQSQLQRSKKERQQWQNIWCQLEQVKQINPNQQAQWQTQWLQQSEEWLQQSQTQWQEWQTQWLQTAQGREAALRRQMDALSGQIDTLARDASFPQQELETLIGSYDSICKISEVWPVLLLWAESQGFGDQGTSAQPLAKEPPEKTPTKQLDPALRKEILRYAKLGLDARIISQKTGVALALVEILVSMQSPAESH